MFIFLFITAFLAVMYILIYAKRIKQNKKSNELSAVEEYRKNYTERRRCIEKQRDILTQTKKYVTKYNSSEDYRASLSDSCDDPSKPVG